MGKLHRGLAFGWVPDLPDFRDFIPESEDIAPVLKKVNLGESAEAGVSQPVDLREWCPPVEDQGSIGSCTANAAVGMVEYYERRAFGKHIDASRLFLYKATRNLLHWTGDTGAYLRTTMGALVLFGVPPEEYWPYVVADFEKEPPAFCYAFAQNYQSIRYVRLDPPAIAKQSLLGRIKAYLSAGLPAMFGFTVYNSIHQASQDGVIPYPCPTDKAVGGHAVLAVGFDDKRKIKNATCSRETKGALLIRNSWGTGWGDGGYGWLPYEYVLSGLAIDWWTLLKNEWIDQGVFGL